MMAVFLCLQESGNYLGRVYPTMAVPHNRSIDDSKHFVTTRVYWD